MGNPSIDWEWLAYEHGFVFDDKAMLEAFYAEMSIDEIAARLKLGANTVHARMEHHGLARRRGGEMPPGRRPTRPGPRPLGNRRGK